MWSTLKLESTPSALALAREAEANIKTQVLPPMEVDSSFKYRQSTTIQMARMRQKEGIPQSVPQAQHVSVLTMWFRKSPRPRP